MAEPTYEDANVLLQAAQLWSSNSDVREVGRWIWTDDFPSKYSDFIEQNPPGSDGHSKLLLWAGYFETVATLWKHGLFNQDLLLDWLLIPWSRVSDIILGERERIGEKRLWENFEALGEAQRQA